jgi:hypothetical protein
LAKEVPDGYNGKILRENLSMKRQLKSQLMGNSAGNISVALVSLLITFGKN